MYVKLRLLLPTLFVISGSRELKFHSHRTVLCLPFDNDQSAWWSRVNL